MYAELSICSVAHDQIMRRGQLLVPVLRPLVGRSGAKAIVVASAYYFSCSWNRVLNVDEPRNLRREPFIVYRLVYSTKLGGACNLKVQVRYQAFGPDLEELIVDAVIGVQGLGRPVHV